MRNRSMSVVAGLVVALASAAALACGGCDSASKGAATAPVDAQTAVSAADQQATIAVEGMTCASCSISIRTTLKKLDGVKAVEASHEKNQVSVTYDPAKVKPAQLVEAISKLGYPASLPAKG